MIDKLPAWCGRGVLLSAFVLLAMQNPVYSQDTADAPVNRIVVPLSATAVVNRVDTLSASPSSFDTGMVQIGDNRVNTLVLTHVGVADSDPIRIEAAMLFGKNANEYATEFAGFHTLNPGDSLSIDVHFTPVSPGDKSGGLRLEIEGATSPYVLLFSGKSRWPLTSTLVIPNSVLGFGQAMTSGNSNKTLVLSNEGESGAPVINVSSIQLGGDTPDVFQVDFTPTTLAPGDSMEILVTMASAIEGTKSASVEVFHDGLNPTVAMRFEGEVVTPAAVPVNFATSKLSINQVIKRGTSIQFGPDGKLYVSAMDGEIYVFAVTRNGKNNYSAQKLETINQLKNVQNHNDDGSLNNTKKRLVTGFTVVGTAAAPIIYAASSDWRQGAGPSGADLNLDTNSGIVHKLTKNGNNWSMQNLVRGLPRSEENHVANGIVLDGNKLLLSLGGHTNMGLPSHKFAELSEYALSASIVEIDLGAIGGGTYDLPTLSGTNDNNDPFGGNDGLNQAKLTNNNKVKLYATGLRNAYDLVRTQSGKLYTIDNGPNAGWGGTPTNACTNIIENNGATHNDKLHVVERGDYLGHPNPTRGNKNNKFGGQSPVEIAEHPVECNYQGQGQGASLTLFDKSTNGLDEYTATNFGGAMQGDLVAADYKGHIWRIQLNGNGTAVTSKSKFAAIQPVQILDVTTQGDGDVFPGTMWVVSNNDPSTITVFEPADY
ncbi:MAG: choice-of-anchor D domain-containing protein [Granulosicoccus sp.]